LERAFQDIQLTEGSQVVVELSQLQYISSAGLRAILKQKNALGSRQGRILLVNPQPQVRRVFEIIKALPAQTIFTSLEEMDEYLERVQRQIRED